MRTFLATVRATIVIDDFVSPALQRLHDFVIMDVVQASSQFSDAEIRRINYCRLYLQAETVSDIATVSGKRLDPSKLNGEWSLHSSRRHGNFIYQERPEGAAWSLWRRANKLWSNSTGELTQPLGDWVINSIHDQSQRHFCYWARDHLWVRTEHGYIICEPIGDKDFEETENIHQWHQIPDEATPMEAEMVKPGCWRWNTATYVLVSSIPSIGSFTEFIESLPKWERELLIHTTMSTDAYAVGVALEHGIRAVSDGSEWFKTQGSFGWILSSDEGERLATGMGPASGSRPNSFRSEGYGLLALLLFLQRLAEYIQQHEPWVGMIATDSKSLVDTVGAQYKVTNQANQLRSYRRPLNPLSPEWDVVVGIQHLLHDMPGLQFQHIRGHQDKTTEFHRLPLLAQLNVEADELANRYQRDLGTHRPDVLLTKWAGAHLVLPSGTITSHYEAALRYHASAEPLRQYMRDRNQWTQITFDTINWSSHGHCIRSNMQKRTHLIKLVHGILPTNSKLHRRDPIRSLCPGCKRATEDWCHIIKCTTPTRSEWRTAAIRSIDQKCELLQTQHELRTLLITAITTWTRWEEADQSQQFTITPSKEATTAIRRLIARQNAIGWHQVFLGRFCVDWSDIQEAHYAKMLNSKEGKKRSGQRWQQSVISEIWTQWFLLWEMRNQDLHGATESARTRAAREEVERTLRDLYDLREQMEPSVQHLLCRDLSDHFAKPLWYNKNWLAVHGPLIKQSIRRAKKKAIQGVRSIRTYFTPR
jgi:hypothetical protein